MPTSILPAPGEPAALVRRETRGNVLVTVVVAAAATWLLFHDRAGIAALDAPPGGIFGILPGTFNFTLLLTIGLTLVIRARVARGAVRRASATESPRRIAWLPANVLLRAFVLAALVTLLFVPATFALVAAGIGGGVLPSAWSFGGMLAFFEAYFVLVALAITPVIAWRALRD